MAYDAHGIVLREGTSNIAWIDGIFDLTAFVEDGRTHNVCTAADGLHYALYPFRVLDNHGVFKTGLGNLAQVYSVMTIVCH
ncbi:MAG: hypothetical protein NTY86_20740 [Deltaproteobacteria bacterium]|nr:hypothetical protein [Deltaproteobacteria bacterium]